MISPIVSQPRKSTRMTLTVFRPLPFSSEFSTITLMAGVGVLLLGDIVRGALELRDEFGSGSFAAAAGVLGPLVIAAGALDPTMAARNRRVSVNAALGIARTIGLSVAVLAPLTVLLALMISDLGTSATRIVIALAALLSVSTSQRMSSSATVSPTAFFQATMMVLSGPQID